MRRVVVVRRPYVVAVLALSIGLAVVAAASLAGDSPQKVDGKQPAPKPATLEATHVPLATALADLARQTSESASDLLGDPDPVVDLDLRQVPFWQALDAIAEKANARVDLHSRDGVALVRRPAGWKPPPISHDGLFRTSLSAVAAKLDLETDAHTYTAAVEVAWESHLLPILLETRPQSLVVRDNAGRLLPATAAAGSSLAPVDGRISLPIDVTLPPLSCSVRGLSVLEGQLYAVAPTKMLTFTFDSLDALAKACAGRPPTQSHPGAGRLHGEPGRRGGRPLVGGNHSRLSGRQREARQLPVLGREQ